MTILDEITEHKKKQVAIRKQQMDIKTLKSSHFFKNECLSLKHALKKSSFPGIIAEFKRKSPSKGIINNEASAEVVAMGYCDAGAAGISVLTDDTFFGGSPNDLTQVRNFCPVPILRKDFIIDEYQIFEAKAIGADVILLIAAVLTKEELYHYTRTAKSLGMEILFEVHEEHELDKLNEEMDIVGVNNRNLKDFSVDIHTSVNLAEQIPSHYVKISESGISHPDNLVKLHKSGFQGFLIGETFMKEPMPHLAMDKYVKHPFKNHHFFTKGNDYF